MAEIVAVDDGVTHPRDVAQVVLLTLVHLDENVDMLLVDSPHRVLDDGGVAVAQFVVLIYQRLLGVFVALGGELLGLEHGGELACLVDLAKGSLLEHATLDLAVGNLFVALKDNLAHLHL